jgi:hypothetical protein
MIDKTAESEGMAFQILSAKMPSDKNKKEKYEGNDNKNTQPKEE